MAMTGGTGRVGFFIKHAELGKQYTVRNIFDFFKEKQTDFGDLCIKKSKNIYFNLKNAKCYDITIMSKPNRVVVNSRDITSETQEKLTFEVCRAEALKYETRYEWCRKSESTYKKAFRKGWFPELCSHMRPPKNQMISDEEMMESALRFSSVVEWRKKDQRCQQTAKHRRPIEFYNKCIQHMIDKEEKQLRELLTKDECIKEGLKYKTNREWQSAHPKTYNRAVNLSCASEVTKLRRELPEGSIYEEDTLNTENGLFLELEKDITKEDAELLRKVVLLMKGVKSATTTTGKMVAQDKIINRLKGVLESFC